MDGAFESQGAEPLVFMRSPTSPTCRLQRHLNALALHNRALRIISEGPDHLHHHPSCRRRRVDRFGQAAEARLAVGGTE